ncbi:MAG: phosphoribosylformylglycinamidine synthase subunit PurS [Candidatus Bathyarchaeia archaeon]
MRFQARVEVRLKRGYFDPEGQAAAYALRDLGYPVEEVRVYKAYEFAVDVNNEKEARELVDDMCKKVLANPTKDDYQIYLEVIA